jgi:hypothetical protein
VVVLDVEVVNRWLAGDVGFSFFFIARSRNGACAAWQQGSCVNKRRARNDDSA